jgi:hypothetical protein
LRKTLGKEKAAKIIFRERAESVLDAIAINGVS